MEIGKKKKVREREGGEREGERERERERGGGGGGSSRKTRQGQARSCRSLSQLLCPGKKLGVYACCDVLISEMHYKKMTYESMRIFVYTTKSMPRPVMAYRLSCWVITGNPVSKALFVFVNEGERGRDGGRETETETGRQGE